MDCTFYVGKTKALISCAVRAQMIFAFVFAYSKSWFTHDAAHVIFCCSYYIEFLVAFDLLSFLTDKPEQTVFTQIYHGLPCLPFCLYLLLAFPLCCSYTEANIITNEENDRNLKFALQFVKII